MSADSDSAGGNALIAAPAATHEPPFSPPAPPRPARRKRRPVLKERAGLPVQGAAGPGRAGAARVQGDGQRVTEYNF